MGVRKEQREKRRWEILETALELFIRNGYTETRISDIAEKAGISVGLLFHYFGSKLGLYEELVRIGMEGPAQVIEFDDSDPLCYFETIAGYILSAIKGSSFTAKMFVLMVQVRLISSVPESVKGLLDDDTLVRKSIAVITAGQSTGQIREGDPLAMAILFWQSISGIALFAAIQPQAPLPESEWIVEFLRRNK